MQTTTSQLTTTQPTSNAYDNTEDNAEEDADNIDATQMTDDNTDNGQ